MPATFWTNKRACVTGGAGFLGRAVCDVLRTRGAGEVFVPRSAEYDLTQRDAARRLYHDARPDVLIHLAAEVGGIGANRRRPGRFFYANMAMGLHLIEEARAYGRLAKFVQVGTVCAYPKHCGVPFVEDDLWSGFPEETNAPYGVAKKALLVMLQAYSAEYGLNGVYVLPANLYGPGDNFDPETSHVIPALIRRFSEAVATGADRVRCWGTGQASREFLYVDDAADGVVTAAERCERCVPINLGTGRETTIAELAARIAALVGFDGRIEWDPSQPDGQPRRVLDTAAARKTLGWSARIDLDQGLARTLDWWRSRCPQPSGA